jgi:uncharacterized protein (DUF305 family)
MNPIRGGSVHITWRLATVLILLCVLSTKAQQELHKHAGYDSAVDPAWSELNASMEKMHVAMAAIESSRNSDVDFVRLMLPHHEAAIEMARTELMHGKDPQMRRFAQEVIADQQSEIELMKLWLKQRGLSSPRN